jgi:hypothetical protein
MYLPHGGKRLSQCHSSRTLPWKVMRKYVDVMEICGSLIVIQCEVRSVLALNENESKGSPSHTTTSSISMVQGCLKK